MSSLFRHNPNKVSQQSLGTTPLFANSRSWTMARLLVLGLFAVMAAMVSADDAVSCQSVASQLAPCVGYITDSADSPSTACCNGVKNVSNGVRSKQDLVAVCNCIKGYLPKLGKPADSNRIAHLPHQCGISRDFPPVSPNYDCARIP